MRRAAVLFQWAAFMGLVALPVGCTQPDADRPAGHALHAAQDLPSSVASGDGSVVGRCRVAPVVAPVADPFRPPAQPWLPGNRGLEYATPTGRRVVAAAAGRVTFAGQVGGRLVVTVTHDGGVRSTYSPLASIDLRPGSEVRVGMAIGTTNGPLHFGVLRGSAYLDPAAWLGKPCRAVLVPVGDG